MCDVPILSLKDGAIWSVSLSDKVQMFMQFLFCMASLDGRLNINSCFFLYGELLCVINQITQTWTIENCEGCSIILQLR